MRLAASPRAHAHASRRPAPRPEPSAGPHRAGPCRGAALSSTVPDHKLSSADAVGGVLAATSIFIGAVGVVQTPLKLVPAAIILALVAVRMTDRFRTLAAWAVGLSALWWVLGMTVAVITDNPLY